MRKIKQECPSCNGTGLYAGMCEGPGEAVICIRCGGKGWSYYTYTPFRGRKKREGITKIRLSRGSLIVTGVGGIGSFISYEEFEQNITEEKNALRDH